MRPRKKRHRAHSSHTRDIYAQVSLDATNHLGRSLFIYCLFVCCLLLQSRSQSARAARRAVYQSFIAADGADADADACLPEKDHSKCGDETR